MAARRCVLKGGIHDNSHLYHDYVLNGSSSFSIFVREKKVSNLESVDFRLEFCPAWQKKDQYHDLELGIFSLQCKVIDVL